jgi:hypothetical protein
LVDIADYSDGAIVASATAAKTLTGVAKGRYYAKARATYALGFKGPWEFNNGISFVYPSLAKDDFTAGTAGTLLGGKSAVVGGPWTALATSDNTPALSSVGTLMGPTTASKVSQHNVGSAAFGAAGVWAELDIIVKSNSNLYSTSVVLRSNGNLASRYGIQMSYTGTGGIIIYQVVAGAATSIMTWAGALTIGATYRLRIELLATNHAPRDSR